MLSDPYSNPYERYEIEVEVSFFGGPWDGEDHPVPAPLQAVLFVPTFESDDLLAPPNAFIPCVVTTASYIRCVDEDGEYYVCDGYGR